MKISSRSAGFVIFLFIFSLAQQAFAAQVRLGATFLTPTEPLLPATSMVAPVISLPDSKTAAITAQFSSSTISHDTSIELSGAGTGSKLEMPIGLTMTAPAWSGAVDIAYTTVIPPTVTGISTAKIVSVDFDGMEGIPVKLSGAALVAIPYVNFSDVANSIVKIVDMAGEAYVLSECTLGQYLSPGSLDRPLSYFLPPFVTGGAQHCYTYDEANVYIVSNHFSTFIAGVAAPVVEAPIVPVLPAPVISGSSGGGSGGGIQLFSSSPVSLPSPPSPLPLSQAQPSAAVVSPLSPPSARSACSFKAVQPKKIFSDVPVNTWYSAAVTRFAELGILKKYLPLFSPANRLRRYEALILSMDAFGIKPARKLTKDPFVDVRKRDSFAGYVKSALDLGIITSGKPTFSPHAIINRAEAVTILLRTAKANIKEYENRTFSYHRDVPTNQWYFPYITKASDLCILIGYSDGTARPEQAVIRSEFIVLLDRTMQHFVK